MAVPKVIHRIWIGGEEPEWQAGFRESWEQPGWELRQWGDEEVAELGLRNQSLYDRARGRFAGQLRSDILRYEILHRYGGVYVDADFECRRPLAELEEMVDGASCFAAWEEQDIWINNALMGCEPGHSFVEELIARLPASLACQPHARPTITTGPQFLTGIYREAFVDEVRVLPQRLFYPYLWNELMREREEFPNAFAVHHWGNRRRERWQPKTRR